MDTAFNLISIEASTTLQSTHDDTLENWIIFCENNRRMGKRKNHVLYFNTYAIPKLLSCQAETKDALLHAINEEYVEAVEVSCDWLIHLR